MNTKVFIKFMLILVLLFCSYISMAQDLSRDVLESFEYEELLTEFNRYDGDTVNQAIIARTYLNRARKEGDTIKMARGYDRLARIYDSKKNIQFADSIIMLTRHMQHQTYPALGYMIKGYEYYLINDLVGSTENFMKCYELASVTGNISQKVYILDALIFIKAVWGDKCEALELQHRRHSMIANKDYRNKIEMSTRKGADIDVNQLLLNDRITSNSNYAFCYVQLNDWEEAEKYIERCQDDLEKYSWVGKKGHQLFIEELSITIEYQNGNFGNVLRRVNNFIDTHASDLRPSRKLFLLYLAGMANIKVGDDQQGYSLLKKADSIYDKNQIIIKPEHRLLFNELLTYYEKLNIPEKQIDYLNKLIYVDSIAKVYYKYFDADLKQKIETPDLLKAKERLILRLQENNSRFVKANIFIGAILVICVVSLLYFVYKKKIYKDRFEALLNTVESSIPNHKNTYNTYEISSDVVQTVIDKLNDFEARELFLSCNISLLTLAKSFETNANYLSRVINLKIGKNFSQYINDLRIDYATKNILNNPKLRKYTIKAIAEECGYRNAESFSKAFYKRHKIYPSFYIKELNKQKSKG